jgi:hypothetical protein
MDCAVRKSTASAGVRFTDSLRVRCPASLPTAIDLAAAKNLTTPSEYVRRSVIERLRSDGIDPGDQNKRSLSQASEV